jgi:hypothetical protein
MSDCNTYDTMLKGVMHDTFERHPEFAGDVSVILGRLRRRDFYDLELVDAIFQKWERFPLDLVDAYGFAMVYSLILSGKVRLARIPIGSSPYPDKETDLNNAGLAGLPPQFSADFDGGTADHDGHFRWHGHVHLGGPILPDPGACTKPTCSSCLVEGPTVTIDGPQSVPLEVGYQSAAKTLSMLGMGQFSVARWPYGSETLWLMCRVADAPFGCEPFTVTDTVCTRDDHGWPCARVPMALLATPLEDK